MDPSQGERYTEPLRDEDQDVLEHIYNLTVKEEDYVDPSAEGIMDWQCDSSCMSYMDTDVPGLPSLSDGLPHRQETFPFMMVWETQKSLVCHSQNRYRIHRNRRFWIQHPEPPQPDGGRAIRSTFLVGELVRTPFT